MPQQVDYSNGEAWVVKCREKEVKEPALSAFQAYMSRTPESRLPQPVVHDLPTEHENGLRSHQARFTSCSAEDPWRALLASLACWCWPRLFSIVWDAGVA